MSESKLNPNKVNKYVTKVNNILEEGRIPFGQKTKITHVSMGGNKGKFSLNKKQRKTLISALAEATEYGLEFHIAEMPKEYGPIIFDIDLEKIKSDYTTGRLYDDSMIVEVSEYYKEAIIKYLDVDESELKVCIFEKDNLKEKELTVRDGFHGMFHEICTSSKIRYLIREYVIKKADESDTFQHFTKTVSEIFDKSIVNTNAWLMYGCRKIDGRVYKVTKLLSINNDGAHDHSIKSLGNNEKKLKMFSLQQKAWSIENAAPYSENYSEEIINKEYDDYGYNKKSNYEEDFDNLPEMKKQDIEKARTLIALLNDNRAANYTDWMRVGWALHNIDRSLLGDWIDFSQRCPDKYKEGECEERWAGMRTEGLTIRSLVHWAKEDNPEEFKKFLASEYESFLAKSLDINTYYIAKALHNKYSDRFVCVSTKNNFWYEFKNHRWQLSENGTSLMRLISEDFSNDFLRLAAELNLKAINLNGSEKEDAKSKASRTQKICDRLLNITFKKQIMEEAKNLFYENDFEEKLDEINVYLIGFENGVYDLEKEEFRSGKPDDYISLSTKVDYIKYDLKNKIFKSYFDKIYKFFCQILPNENVRKYFLLSLSACVSGDASKEENFRISTGVGSNGKSITFDLLSRALGGYVAACPITIVTRKRNASNQASPELARLKSRRCAIFQETDENENMNVGILKELTGNDKFMVRPMYREPFEVKFQVKWFLCCNKLPTVTAQDEGTWRRLKVIEFQSRFVVNPNPKKANEFPIDPTLKREIGEWAPYFASYLVHLYTSEYKHLSKGIPEPYEIQVSTSSYRNESDTINKFISEYIEVDIDNKIIQPFGSVWQVYRDWYHGLADDSVKVLCRNDFIKQCVDPFEKAGINIIKDKGIQGFFYNPKNDIQIDSDDNNSKGKKQNSLEL